MFILNEAKPKYELLDDLFNQYITDFEFSSNVNIIVDLKEVLKKYFRPEVIFSYENENIAIEEIASDLISIISHYRNFFYKNQKYTTFYFLYSEDYCNKFIEKFSDYKKYYYDKYFVEMKSDERYSIVFRAFNIFKKVIEIIPNVFYINTEKFDENIFIKYLIEKKFGKNELNVILSNDELIFQNLVARTVALNIKGINSEIITNENAVSRISKENFNLPAETIPLLLSISGNKKYSINGIQSYGKVKAANSIISMISSGAYLPFSSVEFPVKVEKLNSKITCELRVLENINLIEKNYEIITGNKILYDNLLNIESEVEKSKLKKLEFNKQYFLELNSKYFTIFPLMLDMLLKGEIDFLKK